jgi:hypothetical protein
VSESVKTAFRNPQLFQNRVKVSLQDIALTKWVPVPSLKNVPDFFLAYRLPQNPNELGIIANFTNGVARLGCLFATFPRRAPDTDDSVLQINVFDSESAQLAWKPEG